MIFFLQSRDVYVFTSTVPSHQSSPSYYFPSLFTKSKEKGYWYGNIFTVDTATFSSMQVLIIAFHGSLISHVVPYIIKAHDKILRVMFPSGFPLDVKKKEKNLVDGEKTYPIIFFPLTRSHYSRSPPVADSIDALRYIDI